MLIFSCSKDKDSVEKPIKGSRRHISLYTINRDKIAKIENYIVTGKELEYQNDTEKQQEVWNAIN